MFLSPTQINEIVSIIRLQQAVFIVDKVGVDVLDDEDLRTLENAGVDITKINKLSPIEEQYIYGMMALSLRRAEAASYSEFKSAVKSKNYFPLSEVERAAIERIKYQTYSDIKGLGNRYINKLQTVLVEVDEQQRLQIESIIRSEATKAVVNRKTIKEFSAKLKSLTQDWARDFDRIADFIMHDAYDQGRAFQIEKMNGKEALVYKRVYPSACKHCKRLYLQGNFGSEPKVFTLKQLQMNGTNIGRKTKDWKPVVGPTHPWCRCTLEHKKAGFDWNPNTQRFSTPNKTN